MDPLCPPNSEYFESRSLMSSQLCILSMDPFVLPSISSLGSYVLPTLSISSLEDIRDPYSKYTELGGHKGSRSKYTELGGHKGSILKMHRVGRT